MAYRDKSAYGTELSSLSDCYIIPKRVVCSQDPKKKTRNGRALTIKTTVPIVPTYIQVNDANQYTGYFQPDPALQGAYYPIYEFTGEKHGKIKQAKKPEGADNEGPRTYDSRLWRAWVPQNGTGQGQLHWILVRRTTYENFLKLAGSSRFESLELSQLPVASSSRN